MNEISHEIKLWFTLYDDVFILTLFCLPKNVQSYRDKRAKFPEKIYYKIMRQSLL